MRCVFAATHCARDALRYMLVTVTGLSLLSCSKQSDVSWVSEHVLTTTVPAIEMWARSSGKPLELATLMNGLPGSHVCLVRQYSTVTSSISRAGLQARENFSRFGNYVPENRTALAIVDGDQVHSALFRDADLQFAMNSWTPCVARGKAKLQKTIRPGALEPLVELI